MAVFISVSIIDIDGCVGGGLHCVNEILSLYKWFEKAVAELKHIVYILSTQWIISYSVLLYSFFITLW